jgi:hypothetical protein
MVEVNIQTAYDDLLLFCDFNGIGGNFRTQTEFWQRGYWRAIYQDLVQSGACQRIPNGTVVDMGSKYGHLAVLLNVLGAQEIICVEVEDEYISAGREVFEQLYSNVKYSKSDRGLIALQPDFADLLLSIEIISHANPRFTEIIYSEYSRILKLDGMLVLADGNNLAHANYFKDRLVELYDKWENGPDGDASEDSVIAECFKTRRKNIICEGFPVFNAQQLEYLAANTSGLFGDILLEVVNNYVRTGELIRRPYRRGICPTNPIASGVVMEKGLFVDEILLSLSIYGFSSVYVQRELHKQKVNQDNSFVENSWFTIAGIKVF